MSTATARSLAIPSGQRAPIPSQKYKRTDVGVLPDDWIDEPLEQIAEADRPICYGIVQVGKYVDNGVPVLAIKNLGGNYVHGMHRASPDIERQYTRSRVRALDVLVSVKGTTGRIGIVPEHFQGNISRDLARISVRKDISARFVYHMLHSPDAQRRLVAATVGTTRLELSIAALRLFRVARPPKRREQEAIAAALDDADELIESLEQLIAKKRAIRQGAADDLLTGRRRLLQFRGQWDEVKVGDLLTFKNGLNKAKRYFGSGTPIVNYMDVFRQPLLYANAVAGRVSLTRVELSSFDVRHGDVLFTRTSETQDEIGLASVVLDHPVNTTFSGFLLRGRPTINGLVAAFSGYCFRANYVRNQIVAKASYTTRALTNGKVLSGVSIRLPKEGEQIAIASVLSDMDAAIAALEEKVVKARQIKQGVMHELLTGRVRLV